MSTKFNKTSSLIVIGTLMLSGCSTTPKQKIENNSRSKILTTEPESVGASLAAGRDILAAYSKQLASAQRTRRGINLGVIGTGLYTAIAAGTGAHLHNIVASTAIGGALQLAEPNLQNNGSPESLGSAMVKTVCIIRAGEATQGTTNLDAVQVLEGQETPRSTLVQATLESYNSLRFTILNAIMQVSIDQATSSTPALLDSKTIIGSMGVLSAAEDAAKEKSDSNKGFFTSPAIDPAVSIATVKQTVTIVDDSIKKCLQ